MARDVQSTTGQATKGGDNNASRILPMSTGAKPHPRVFLYEIYVSLRDMRGCPCYLGAADTSPG